MTTYSVIGLYIDDEPVIAGVIEGEHPCVDSDPGGEFQRWATTVEAGTPEEAETEALAVMSSS